MRVTFYGSLAIGMIAADTAKAFDKLEDEDFDYSLAQLESDDFDTSGKDLQDWMLAQTISKAEPENKASAASTVGTTSEVESDAFVTTESEGGSGSESEGHNESESEGHNESDSEGEARSEGEG